MKKVILPLLLALAAVTGARAIGYSVTDPGTYVIDSSNPSAVIAFQLPGYDPATETIAPWDANISFNLFVVSGVGQAHIETESVNFLLSYPENSGTWWQLTLTAPVILSSTGEATVSLSRITSDPKFIYRVDTLTLSAESTVHPAETVPDSGSTLALLLAGVGTLAAGRRKLRGGLA